MKPIAMPAKRLTADCIWNSFLSSGKRNLILTGSKGSGKTTLLSSLFPHKLPGITTVVKPSEAVYLVDNISGKSAMIGIYEESLPGTENKMVLLEDGFAILGIPALICCLESDSPWITIDEIGYLESDVIAYRNLLLKLFDTKQVAAVVRKQDLPFLRELCNRDDVFLVDLDDPFGNIGCVIMASGLGTRFGGNKLMADFMGSPIINRILDATEDTFTNRVVVTRHSDVARLCENRGIQVILHAFPHRSDTVRLGIEAMFHTDRCMFTPADQPLLTSETIASLALASKNCPESIWRTVCGDTQGSPVIFPNWAYTDLQSLPEGKGGSAVISNYPDLVRTVSVYDAYELKDVDTPQDLIELSEL